MANTFIDDVLVDLLEKGSVVSELTFILPSKRAGYFLKNAISKHTDKTLFSPVILSVEEFIESISLLKSIPNTDLLFELYAVYLDITPEELTDDFDGFCKWAQIILQDFNEIDRYLIPQESIFNYLSAVKEVDHWSVSDQKTDLINNYLYFWEKLPQYYDQFTERLISKGLGYQGLLYREAVEKLELYMQHNHEKKHVFLGFNALNTAEQNIIQELLHQEMAQIYWDFDSHFIKSGFHDAGHFARQHKQWRYFENNPFNWEAENYKVQKNIQVIGVPKNVGQAKYVGELLSREKTPGNSLNTAVVLADEALLTPMLNAIPKNIGAVNITMGMPLQFAPLASLFEALFHLHRSRDVTKLYYKDVISITSNPFISRILDVEPNENVMSGHDFISRNNVTFLSLEKLQSLFPSNKVFLEALFGNWKNSSRFGLDQCHQIIHRIKDSLNEDKEDNSLSLEYLFKFYTVFNQVRRLLETYEYAKDIKTLLSLYKEILATETLDFQGEPLQGLQIIGMLESRVIDFETVIITSVNEGILPSGKSNNSFIPFDVKLDFGLPTYKEKDAVYTYHYYHLLQRAKNVYILYNTEIDALNGGEKSRFITQLEVEGIHDINHYTVSPLVPKNRVEMRRVEKTAAIISSIRNLAANGFSPSSLTAYIRNPIDFYHQKVLGINSFEDVEETVAANTLGTIIHNTLEELYKPYMGEPLSVDILTRMNNGKDKVIKEFFAKEFKEGDIATGKNLIIYEISKRYISNFLKKEKEALNNGQRIIILALEKKLTVPLDIPELDYPVYLKGTVDRIDERDGVLRVIDYKTGNVTQGKVEIVDWEDITTDYDKFSKTFQILAYTYMLHLQSPFEKPVEAGIISFKNLQSGLLKFGKKDSPRSPNKDNSITHETLSLFNVELKKLILEICDPEIDFVEKEV